MENSALTQVIRNWSESLEFTPTTCVKASSEFDILDAVRRVSNRGSTLRPMGSRHSSTPIFATDGTVIDISDLSGLYDHTSDDCLVRFGPGTGLAEAGDLLKDVGLSLTNLGDVDYQTIAGAMGTGTHGTGKALGNLSTMLVGGVLISGSGQRIPFGTESGEGEDSEMVRAARVSFRTLGIMTSVTLRVVPYYELRVRKWITHIDWVLAHFEELSERNRHFDFYWYPRNDRAQVRMMNLPDDEGGPTPPGRLKEERTGPAHKVIPNDRHLKFNEMEYMLPLGAGLEAFRQARERIKARHRSSVAWRVLVRTVAADNAMLSPSHARPTLTIALLHNYQLPYGDYFGDMEPLLQNFDGRPHWGKKHTMTAASLRGHYPQWSDFQRIRRQLDPQGVFMSPYLERLLEGEQDE